MHPQVVDVADFWTGFAQVMSRLSPSSSSRMRVSSLFPLMVLLCLTQVSDAFLRSIQPAGVGSSTSATAVSNTKLFNAANLLIRKAKMKEVEKLKEAVNAEGDSHYINEFLKTKKFVDLYGGPIPFIDSVLNRYQSVTIMPEYSKKAKTGFILGLPEPEIMGVIFRDAGARYYLHTYLIIHVFIQ